MAETETESVGGVNAGASAIPTCSSNSSKLTDDPISSELGMLLEENLSLQNPMHMDLEGGQDKLGSSENENENENENEYDDDDDNIHILDFLYPSDSITFEKDRRSNEMQMNHFTEDGREVHHIYLNLDENKRYRPSQCRRILRECGCEDLVFLRISRKNGFVFYAILDENQAAAVAAHGEVWLVCAATEILGHC